MALAQVAASSVDAGTITYDYDAVGRLTSADYPDCAYTNYGYDGAGNRTNMFNEQAPVSRADNITVSLASGAYTFDPAANDYDPDNDPNLPPPVRDAYYVTGIRTQAVHGNAAVNATTHRVTYTPTAGYTGADVFNYTLTDSLGCTTKGRVDVTVTN